MRKTFVFCGKYVQNFGKTAEKSPVYSTLFAGGVVILRWDREIFHKLVTLYVLFIHRVKHTLNHELFSVAKNLYSQTTGPTTNEAIKFKGFYL
jgi:hypothetical protein